MPDEKPFRAATEADLKAQKIPKGRPATWPFMTMQVGDTVAVVDPSRFHSARTGSSYAGKVKGWKFKTATMANGSLLIRRLS